MRIVFGFLLLILFANPCAALCQSIPSNVDITACFDLNEDQDDLIDRISRQFIRELELKSKDHRFSINIYEGSREDFDFWLDSLSSRFYAIIEVSSGDWVVSHIFNIPFVFNMYQNKFKLEAFVRLYRRGIKVPILIDRFNIKVNGARVYQLLRDDPHDGSLIVSNSRRILYEKKAEKELIHRVSSEIYHSMKEYGG